LLDSLLREFFHIHKIKCETAPRGLDQEGVAVAVSRFKKELLFCEDEKTLESWLA